MLGFSSGFVECIGMVLVPENRVQSTETVVQHPYDDTSCHPRVVVTRISLPINIEIRLES